MRDEKGRFVKGHKVPNKWREMTSKIKKGYRRTKESRIRISKGMNGKVSKYWKEGRVIRHGYAFLYMPKCCLANKRGYVLEHNLIWLKENDLGWHYIPKGFLVHHKDGNKLNNNIRNLFCLPRDYHTKAHWANNDIKPNKENIKMKFKNNKGGE